MSRFLFSGSLCFLFLMPLVTHVGNFVSPFEFPKFCFSALVIIPLFLIYLFGICRSPVINIRLSRTLSILALMLLSAILSYAVSVSQYLSFWGDSQLPADSLLATVLFSLFAFLQLQIINNENRLKILNYVLVAVAAVQTICCLIQIFDLSLPWWAFHLVVFGTQGQTVACASLLGCLAPFICICFFNKNNNQFKNILFGALIFFTNFSILHTGARTPVVVMWLTCIAVSLFFVFHNSQFRSIKKVILLLFLLVLGTSLFKNTNSTSDLVAKTSPALLKKGYIVRKLLLESGLKAWEQKPILGYGPYTFSIAQRPFQTTEMNLYEYWEYGWLKAHNHLLEILVDQGLVGFLLALFLYGYLLIKAAKLFFKRNHSEAEIFALASFAGYNFLFISNLTAFNMIPTQMLYTLFPVFFSLGTSDVTHKSISIKSSIRVVTMLICLFVLGNVLVSTFRVWKADILIQSWSRNPVLKEDRIKSIELTYEAIALNPSEPIYYCFVGQLYEEMLVNNHKILKQEDLQKALDAIDDTINECMSRGSGLDYLVRLSALVYNELYFQGVISSPDKALALFERMKTITPFSPRPVLDIGRLKLQAGHPQEFIGSMNEAIALKPDYVPAYIELCNYFYKENDIDSVWQTADRLSKVEFYSPEFVPYIQDLVLIAGKREDTHSKEIFQAIYEKFKYLIPPPLKFNKTK